MRYSTKADRPVNRCMECGEPCKLPKRFCSEEHKIFWLKNSRGIMPPEHFDPRPPMPRLSPEALEWKRKLSLSRPF